jgi:hypothetical protein
MPINVLKLGEGFLLTRSPILASPPPIRQDNTLVRRHLGRFSQAAEEKIPAPRLAG